MKFGLQHPSYSFDYRNHDSSHILDSLKNLVISAETLGFDSFWVMDHFHQIPIVGKQDEPMLESWTTISVLAGITSKIKLGTMMTGIIYRHPSILAKIGATLDVLSKGRLFMGIGAAWNEEESLAYGISFPSIKERFVMLEEAVQIIRKMWTDEPSTSFNGKYYQIKNAYCNPKPVQKPSPPIMIGGSGERQTLRIVAKYADACNLFGSAETVKRKLGILKEHCKSVDRDYDSILKTKLGVVVIEDERELARKRLQQIIKVPEEQVDEFAIYGTPEDVLRQKELFEEAGIQYLIVDLDPSKELEALNNFTKEIIKKP
jgi:F420-dependent oxidoreductase-like protein